MAKPILPEHREDGFPSSERAARPDSPFLDEAQFATDYASVRPDRLQRNLELESPSATAFEQPQRLVTLEREGEVSEDPDRESSEPDEPSSFQEQALFSARAAMQTLNSAVERASTLNRMYEPAH